MGIKHNGKTPKVSADIQEPEMPSFSFRYLTKRKEYNFEKLDRNSKKEWQSALLELMINISKTSWISLGSLGKDQKGYETLSAKQIGFSPSEYILSDDEKVMVFRFKGKDGRIIGKKDDKSSVFYVFGVDTDLSAYSHGR